MHTDNLHYGNLKPCSKTVPRWSWQAAPFPGCSQLFLSLRRVTSSPSAVCLSSLSSITCYSSTYTQSHPAVGGVPRLEGSVAQQWGTRTKPRERPNRGKVRRTARRGALPHVACCTTMRRRVQHAERLWPAPSCPVSAVTYPHNS